MAEGRGSTRDAQGRRTCAGGSDEDTSAGGAVELTLRLSTGSGAAEEEEEEKAAAARSMTIFYNGRVCTVDVTELQARAIISMANQDILTEQQRRDHDRHQHQDSSSSSSASGTTAQSGDGSGHQNPTPVALLRAAHCHASPASPRQGLSEVAPPPPMINHASAGLSMKRSLQRFLQKRKARATAVASPYAGGGRPAGPADQTLG